jgi:hypothetical protein
MNANVMMMNQTMSQNDIPDPSLVATASLGSVVVRACGHVISSG